MIYPQVPACVEQRREQVQRAPRRGDAALLLQRQGVPEEDVRSRQRPRQTRVHGGCFLFYSLGLAIVSGCKLTKGTQ